MITAHGKLPSLSKLRVGTDIRTTLWGSLAREGGGKNPECKSGEEKECFEDGYLMVKKLEGVERDCAGKDAINKNQTVMCVEMKVVQKEASDEKTVKTFESVHGKWKSKFDDLCDNRVKWNKFKEELLKWSDWYVLDEQPIPPPDRSSRSDGSPSKQQKVEQPLEYSGHLFVKYFYDENVKTDYAMPKDGIFQDAYLFVTLVCGKKGRGDYLIKVAHALAQQLNVKTVVLATITNVATAGFYYKKHDYRFCNRNGVEIDVSSHVSPDGRLQEEALESETHLS